MTTSVKALHPRSLSQWRGSCKS